jgi:hypothetical protein
MRRAAHTVARAGVSVLVGLIGLAVLRWPPVWARPFLDVRALTLAGPAVVLAVIAALTGRPRVPRPVRPLLIALGGVLASLAIVVALRPAAGLLASVADPRGPIGSSSIGAIDVAGPDLRHLPAARKWTLRWEGELRAPRSGVYRLWASGRGEVAVSLDGHAVLRAEGDPMAGGSEVPIAQGPHRAEVVLTRTGPGPRLRLGWTWPERDGRPGGYDEILLPRDLGPAIACAWWWATDVLAVLTAILVAALIFHLPWDAPRPPPVAAPVTRGEIGWSLAGYAALVTLMSWPLVTDLAGLGVTDRPDGRLNAWILAWDAHALAHAPGRLFQAPIFHPLPDTLAFSENLLLPAVIGAPFQALGGPVLAYNAVLLVSLIVSGLGVQLLVRRESGDRWAAFIAGAFFAAGAHRWIRLAHLHAQVTLFLPFVLLAFDRFWQRRTLGRAALVGVLLALQGLSSVYLGAIAALIVAVAVALAILGGLRPRETGRLALGLALGGLLLAPIVRPYLRMRAFEGVEFTIADVASYATTLESYAAAGTRLYGPVTQKHLDPALVQDTLFPGLAVLVCGLIGLASAPRRYRLLAVTASAVAIVFSLGPETAAYRFLHEHLVFVRGVRALSRFSLVPVLALSVLAGFALARRWRMALLVLVLFLVESSNVPIRYAPAPAASETARWLAGRPGAVVVVPLGERDTEVMLDGTAHWRPLVNGDSGFMPRPYTREMELLTAPGSDDALRLLRAIDVRHVVGRDALPLPVVFAAAEERVYQVTPGPAARVPEAGAAVPTVWTATSVTADLGTPRPLESIVFEVSDAPWVDAPAVEVSSDGVSWTPVAARASLADATLSLLRDPRHGIGEVTFPPVTARFVRMAIAVAARPGVVRVR